MYISFRFERIMGERSLHLLHVFFWTLEKSYLANFLIFSEITISFF
jgi:hypothetical protein